ncbi:glycosyltransferase [Celeribacter baekdonensis]|uniref:glycosyltransferase n=1 Tax=Celeribacter baekdonensis TaxID=875171 RepID=UPI003A908A8A
MKNWKGIYATDRTNRLALRMWLHEVRATGDVEQVKQIVDEAVAELPSGSDRDMTKAELFSHAALFDPAAVLYEQMVLKHPPGGPKGQSVRLSYLAHLRRCGGVMRAASLMDDIASEGLTNADLRLLTQMRAAAKVMTEASVVDSDGPKDGVPRLLIEAVNGFCHRAAAPATQGALGRIVLISVGLGVGGAERQLSLLARTLNDLIQDEAVREVSGPVEVLALNLSASEKRDRLLADLTQARVAVTDVQKLPIEPHTDLDLRNDTLEALFPLLPNLMQQSVARLVPYFRTQNPDVVSIWQDSAIFATALAALIAEVPKIQLNLRTVMGGVTSAPFDAQMRAFTRALALLPSVALIGNSHAVAQSYESHLGLPKGTVSVIPNGTPTLTEVATADERALWTEFDQATAGADRTLGVICRFHSSKRITQWVEFAHHYLQRHPLSRFVLVGDGPEMDQVRALVEARGLKPRLLLPGLSRSIGFWLDKMDCFVHLSRIEGMPNVLVEAQIAGVPFVATDAGGSADCLANDHAGIFVKNSDPLDVSEVTEAVDVMLARWRETPDIARITQHEAMEKFSVQKMAQKHLEAMRAPFHGAIGRVPLPKGH